jgi:mono/diheme cytochrome c family protein
VVEVPEPAPAPSAARLSVASGLFRQYCLVCHGPRGTGAEIRASMPAIPDFTSRDWQATANSTQLAVSILEGKGTLMPSFRGRIDEDQAQNLVAYVRAFGPEPVKAELSPDASDFERRYRQLSAEWDELEKRMRELQPARKP